METDKLPSDHVHGLRTRWARFISLLKILKKIHGRSIKQKSEALTVYRAVLVPAVYRVYFVQYILYYYIYV